MPPSAINPIPPLIPKSVDFQTPLVETLPGNEDTQTQPFLTQYDLGVQAWLRAITLWDGRVMPVVFASPLRAFSTYRQLLQKNQVSPLVPPVDADLDFAKPPLPFISFARGDFKPGPRQNQNYPIRNIAFVSNTNKRRTGWARYPMSVLIPYQIEVWTKSFEAQAYLVQSIMGQFWPKIAYWYLTTSLVPNLLMPIKLVGVSDTSSLEGGQDGERLLRITFNVEIEGQMFFPIFQAPTFERELKQIGTVNEDGTNEVIDISSNADVSGGLAGPSTETISQLPTHPQ